MFEQELYNAEPVEKSQEGDLFHNYEVKNWDLGPRIYKILAVSAIFNLIALGFVARSDNILTRKGCDSPWVGRVCQVLDMAYVGTMIFGTEREFIDAEYERIDLGDAEITFIDVSGAEPLFRYPADYDKYANPEKLAAQQAAQDALAGFNNGFSNPATGGDLIASAPKLPPPNPNAVTGTVPDSPFSFSDDTNTKVSGVKNRRKKNPTIGAPSNTNTDQTVAQNDANSNTDSSLKSDPVQDVEINKRPIVDLGNAINELKAKGPLNLESEFTITGKGKLDKNGRFDPKSFRFGPTTGNDQATVDVVKASIEAVNEAGYLAYIKDVVGKELSFIFVQNTENIEATLQTDFENDSLAKARKSTFDFALAYYKKKKQGANAGQNDKDDLALLEGVVTEVAGKTLKIKFVVPKTIAHPMIQRKLAEQAAENQKPSGSASKKHNGNSALK